MNFNITTKNGATLNTSGKYCPENIGVVPRLQSKTVTENGTVTPDTGYCGLEQVVVNVESSSGGGITPTNYSGTFTFTRKLPYSLVFLRVNSDGNIETASSQIFPSSRTISFTDASLVVIDCSNFGGIIDVEDGSDTTELIGGDRLLISRIDGVAPQLQLRDD